MRTTGNTSTRTQWTGRPTAAILLLAVLAIGAGCTTTPPEGTPIDLDGLRNFKAFDLKTLSGESRKLDDYLARATLVSFFFPT